MLFKTTLESSSQKDVYAFPTKFEIHGLCKLAQVSFKYLAQKIQACCYGCMTNCALDPARISIKSQTCFPSLITEHEALESYSSVFSAMLALWTQLYPVKAKSSLSKSL